MFVIDSGASMHMLSKKDLSSDEMETLRRSRAPTTVVTANGEVQTNEEAQVYVRDLDMFVTVQLLDETPAVLSLGRLCSEHGCSYEWKKRWNSTIDPKWEDNYLYNGQLCTSCRTRIVIISQQQIGFHIETKGSVKFFRWIGNIIKSSDDSKWQASMRENDVDRSWQASLGKPWTSTQRRRDGQGKSNARHSRLVTALHRWSRGPGDACARTFLWKRDLWSGRWCFKSGDTKTEAQYLYSLPQRPELRRMLENQNYEDSLQKTRWGICSRAEKFDDFITADHKVLNEGSESRNNHRYAVVVQDLATKWIQSFPCENKNSQETVRSLRKFLEPSNKPKVIYTDNSLEFGKSYEELSWNHRASTPYRSETNGIAERAIRRIKEGTAAVLVQSGSDEKWWSDSVECYCYLRNIQDLLADGKTPCERRFGESCKGPIIPSFWANGWLFPKLWERQSEN